MCFIKVNLFHILLLFQLQIKDFQIKLEVKNDRSEDLDKARGQIEMLIKEISELKQQLELIKLKKDQEITDIVAIHKTTIGAKDDEIKAVVDKLEAQVCSIKI